MSAYLSLTALPCASLPYYFGPFSCLASCICMGSSYLYLWLTISDRGSVAVLMTAILTIIFLLVFILDGLCNVCGLCCFGTDRCCCWRYSSMRFFFASPFVAILIFTVITSTSQEKQGNPFHVHEAEDELDELWDNSMDGSVFG
jgi:cytochrome bd-type quinol oxidase subunit 2